MMVSRAAINKSWVILICVLVLGTAVEVSAYYYVQKNVSYPSSASSLASPFEVANLTVNPFQASIGQSVAISVSVVNIGSTQSSYSLTFKINDTVAETKQVALSANQTQQVSFSISEQNVGLYNVTVGDIAGIFTVSAKPTPLPATLSVTNLFLNPVEAWPNQPVNVSVDLVNTGSADISYSLPFFVNGQSRSKCSSGSCPWSKNDHDGNDQ